MRKELEDIGNRVKLYMSLNRFDSAEKLVKSALNDYGPLANLHNLLGYVYHQQSQFHEAINQFNRALTINPDFLEAGLNLVATLCDIGHYGASEELFEKLVGRINPRKKQPNLVLGRIANRHAQSGELYHECGMVGEAIQEYKKAIAMFDGMADVRLSLAKLYLKIGQFEKSKQELEDIIKIKPDSSEARTWLGIVLFKAGKQNDARSHWEKAMEINPNNVSAKAYLSYSHNKQFNNAT